MKRRRLTAEERRATLDAFLPPADSPKSTNLEKEPSMTDEPIEPTPAAQDFHDFCRSHGVRELENVEAERAAIVRLVEAGSFAGAAKLLDGDDFTNEATQRAFDILQGLRASGRPTYRETFRKTWLKAGHDPKPLAALLKPTPIDLATAVRSLIDLAAMREIEELLSRLGGAVFDDDTDAAAVRSRAARLHAVLGETITRWNERIAALPQRGDA